MEEQTPKAPVTEAPATEVPQRVEVSDAEKVILIRMENEFLKTNSEITRLQSVLKNVQEVYPAKLKELAAKYGVNLETHFFDGLELVFKLKPIVQQPPVQK